MQSFSICLMLDAASSEESYTNHFPIWKLHFKFMNEFVTHSYEWVRGAFTYGSQPILKASSSINEYVMHSYEFVCIKLKWVRDAFIWIRLWLIHTQIRITRKKVSLILHWNVMSSWNHISHWYEFVTHSLSYEWMSNVIWVGRITSHIDMSSWLIHTHIQITILKVSRVTRWCVTWYALVCHIWASQTHCVTQYASRTHLLRTDVSVGIYCCVICLTSFQECSYMGVRIPWSVT